jgi:hypothetical protein
MGKGGAAQDLKDPLHFNSDSGDNSRSLKMEDPIEKLNRLVKMVADKNPDEPTYELLRKEPSSFWDRPDVCIALGMANPTVYVRRWEWFAMLLSLNALFWIGNYVVNESHGLAKYAALLVILWWYSDFKGGMLHVVLDTPANIKYPVIGLPSLEFQLHHAIPQDIVIKGIWQACADLNPIAVYAFILVAAESGFDPLAMAIGETILLCSYCGQFSHQATHKLSKDRSETVKFLQRVHILLPPEVHRKHHQTHDKDFAILNGWSNPVLAQMLKVFPQHSCAPVWVGMFLTATAFDAVCLAYLLRPLLDMI